MLSHVKYETDKCDQLDENESISVKTVRHKQAYGTCLYCCVCCRYAWRKWKEGCTTAFSQFCLFHCVSTTVIAFVIYIGCA